MEQLVISPGFCPPGIIAHTSESVRHIPPGQYTITGLSIGPDGERLLTLQQDDFSYLVEEAFLNWENKTSLPC